tara:strand:+ start:126 stop:353 length:228 start_codon:yes stop_codon:yes gene_type:complete
MMTSKLDWTVHDIHLALLKVKADGEKALEELDKPEYEKSLDFQYPYTLAYFRARVELATDILNMLYKDDLVMKEE